MAYTKGKWLLLKDLKQKNAHVEFSVSITKYESIR